MRYHRPVRVLICLLGIIFSRAIPAQNIVCPDAKVEIACSINATTTTFTTVRVKLTQGGAPIKGAKVTFEPDQGTIDPQAFTDASGVATALWRTEQPLKSEVKIKVVADYSFQDKATHTVQTITLKPPAKGGLGLSASDLAMIGDGQSWYAGKQLREPVMLRIDELGPDKCPSVFVQFKAYGENAAATPDSVQAQWGANGCVAQSNWKLASIVGRQSLRAQLAEDPTVQRIFRATARKTPWLAIGLGLTHASGFVGVKKIPRDSTKDAPLISAPDNVRRGALFSPILGVNFPVATSADWLRFSLAADLKHVDTDWFGGISLLQLTNRLAHEDLGIDLQFVLHASRRAVLIDVPGCQIDPKKCDTRSETGIVGVGLAFEADATGALSGIAGFFK